MTHKERVQARAIEFALKNDPEALCASKDMIKKMLPLAELCIKHEAEAWENGYMERMVETDREMNPNPVYVPINVKLQALGYIE